MLHGVTPDNFVGLPTQAMMSRVDGVYRRVAPFSAPLNDARTQVLIDQQLHAWAVTFVQPWQLCAV